MGTVTMDLRVALRTTLLVVDDDVQQLALRALALKRSGFNVLTAGTPIEAISIMENDRASEVDVAILDYEMPVMNGCVLADYLRTRYREMRIILYSGTLDIAESDGCSVDAFVAKGDGLARLIEEISALVELTRGVPIPAAAPKASPSSRSL